MTRNSSSNYPALAILILSAVLAAVDWYLKPVHMWIWIVALMVIGSMVVALFRLPEEEANQPKSLWFASSARPGIVCAGLIMAISLGAKLAAMLGVLTTTDLALRLTMAMNGIFLVVTGNAIPKVLERLPLLAGYAAALQAARRFIGWTWVLAGFALSLSWLLMPIAVAEISTFILVPCGMLLMAVQVVRLRSTRKRAA